VRRLVPKDKAKGYGLVQRRFAKVREAREIPYGWVTDNLRIARGYDRYGSPGDYAPAPAGFYHRDYRAEALDRVEGGSRRTS